VLIAKFVGRPLVVKKVTGAFVVVGRGISGSVFVMFADPFVNVTNNEKVNEQGVPPVIGNVALLLLIFDDPFTKVTVAVVPVPYAAPDAAGPAVIV
jgi:hypothetical protein